MSQYPTEREPGFVVAEPATVVVTDIDDRGGAPVEDSPAAAGQQVTDVAKDQASNVAAEAKDQASNVAAEAKDQASNVAAEAKTQASNVAAEAKTQAKDLLGQGREELQQQATQQQERVAHGLHSLSEELGSMASGSTQGGLATDLAREAADRTHSIATWLESREPGQLLDEVRSFARERPGTFLGAAAVAGVLVGRLGRGLKDGEPQAPKHAVETTETPQFDPLAARL